MPPLAMRARSVAAGEKVGHTREIARFRGKQARNGCEL